MARDNYYLLLDLDPDKATTWAAIEPQLKKKRNEWSMPHPTRKLEYQKYRGWIPDIEAVLKNDETRRSEAAEAKKLLVQKREAALVDLDRALQITGAKGYLTPADVKTLVDTGGKKWTERDVRDRAAAKGLAIKEQQAKPKPAGEGVDAVTWKAIVSALNILGCADLYALLELSERTSTAELKRRADAEYQRVRTHGDKSKPDINARQELYGHCLKLFDSDAERAKYNYSLSRVRLTAIEEMAAQAGVGESKIGTRVMEELLKQGKQRGIDKEEVIDCVRGVAVKKGWLVELPSVAEADRLEYCYSCQTLGPAGHACGSCGLPFKQPCPKCGNVNPSSARNCGKCLFAIGDMPLAERSVNSAKALAANDVAGAMAAVDEALAYWPGHPQAVELRKKLEARAAELRERDGRIREFLDRFDRQRAKREFEGALATLSELQRLAPERPELGTLRPIADAALRDAAAHVARGKKFLIDGKSDEALAAFETALASCSDSREANEAMKSCPPAPPAGAAAVASTTGAALSWRPSPSRGRIEYQLVRKSGSPPTRPDDGEKIATSTNTTHIDSAAPSGQRLYYAVFALRAGVSSHQAALAGPVVRVAEVLDLVAQGGDGSIALTWKPPGGASGIEVWRKLRGEPSGRGDGERVACASTSLVDTGRANGVPVGYRVIAVFQGADGRQIASDGVTCLVTPVQPPPPVTDLEVQLVDRDFRARYSPPPRGLVRVYTCAEPPRYLVGQTLSSNEIAKLGRPLDAAGPGMARGALSPGQTELILLPVTVDGAAHVAGKPCSRSWVPEVSAVKADYRDDGLQVSWSWPAGVTMATLVVGAERFAASPTDPNSLRRVQVSVDQMRAAGGRVRVDVPFTSRLFVVVFSEIDRRGTKQHAAGAGAGSRCEIVPRVNRVATYAIRQKRSLLGLFGPKRYSVELKADGQVELPELLVVSKPDGLPVAPDDGTVIYKVRPQKVPGGVATEVGRIEAPDWPLSRENTSLFHACDEDGRWLELLRGR